MGQSWGSFNCNKNLFRADAARRGAAEPGIRLSKRARRGCETKNEKQSLHERPADRHRLILLSRSAKRSAFSEIYCLVALFATLFQFLGNDPGVRCNIMSFVFVLPSSKRALSFLHIFFRFRCPFQSLHTYTFIQVCVYFPTFSLLLFSFIVLDMLWILCSESHSNSR